MAKFVIPTKEQINGDRREPLTQQDKKNQEQALVIAVLTVIVTLKKMF